MKIIGLCKNRKGVSLAEVVLAMATVIIVITAAVSLLTASVSADVRLGDKAKVTEACESAAECLRFAGGDKAVLAEALAKAGFICSNGDYSVCFGDEKVAVTTDGEKYVVSYNGEVLYEIENK